MRALQSKKQCVYCGTLERPELAGLASAIGAAFWVLLIISFFVPALFLLTGIVFLWMLSTTQIVCGQCGKAFLTTEEIRATYRNNESEGKERPYDHGSANDSKTRAQEEQSAEHKEDNFQKEDNQRIFRCPSCSQKIRVRIPLPQGMGKCLSCDSRFKVSVDDQGNLLIFSVADNRNSIHEKDLTLEDCFEILRVNKDATRQEIKAAYRQRMLEYHPDKVSKLGEELRILAERKAKQINSAYALLRKHGFAQ